MRWPFDRRTVTRGAFSVIVPHGARVRTFKPPRLGINTRTSSEEPTWIFGRHNIQPFAEATVAGVVLTWRGPWLPQ